MYRVFKLHQALLNGVALLVVAAGMIAGSSARIASWWLAWPPGEPCSKDGMILRNFPSRWTGANLPTPSMPRSWPSSEPTHEASHLTRTVFWSRCRLLTIPSPISCQPSLIDACKSITVIFITWGWGGLSSAEGCSRPPMSNASHAPLKEDAQPSCVQ